MDIRPETSSARVTDRGLLVASLAILALSLLLVLLPWGQAWDDALLLEDRAEPKGLAKELTKALHWINLVTWIAMGVVLVAVGAARRRARLGLLAAGAFLATIALAELLKVVVPRLNWGIDGGDDLLAKAMDSWPSGHTASIMAFVLALLMVVSVRWVSAIVIVGSVAAAAVGAGVVLAGWHRPSDVFGGSALAVVVFLVLRRGVGQGSTGRWGVWARWLPPVVAAGSALVVFALSREESSALPLVIAMAGFAFWVAIATTRFGLAR